jgi:hypothetical protein
MEFDRYIVCPQCSSDSHKSQREGMDYCMQSMIHRVAMSYPLVRGSSYNRNVIEQQPAAAAAAE